METRDKGKGAQGGEEDKDEGERLYSSLSASLDLKEEDLIA